MLGRCNEAESQCLPSLSGSRSIAPSLAGKTAEEMLPAIRAEVDQSLRILSAQIIGGKKKKRKAKR